MPRSFNQKLKILYLMKIFQERTDREHPIPVKEIVSILHSWGIKADRKTIYADIEALQYFGMKIGHRRGADAGYFLEDRVFELPELKFLMDTVQSSHFITQEQTQKLVKKLERLASDPETRKLQEQMLQENGVKTPNEEIYTNVERIYDAIAANRQISFCYYEWSLARKLRVKKNGQRYRISPWKMIWNNDSYYLLGVDEISGIVKHYRVDRIKDVKQEKNSRNGAAIFRDFDLGKVSVGTFGMFGGRDTLLKLEFENSMIDVVMDHFGQEAMIFPSDEGHFTFQAHFHVSGRFFGWLAGLGPGVKILSPEKTRREYMAFLRQAMEGYEDRDDSKKDGKIQTFRTSGTK